MSFLALLILLALVAACFLAATKSSGRTLLTVLGVGALLMLLSWPSMKRSPSKIVVAKNHLAKQQTRVTAQKAFAKASTEEMWEHLNRSRISLEGERTQAEKSATASAEVTDVSDATDVETTNEIKLSKSDKKAQQTRPDWVDITPKRVGNVYRQVISSSPYSTDTECHASLEPELREVVRRRIAHLTDGRYRPTIESLGFDLGFVLKEICRQEWVETVDSSVGEMKRVHVLMEFDASIDKQLRGAYRDYQRKFRIAEVGSIAGLALGGLVLLYGLLKFDTWTRGYYSKRLFFGVPAVIIVIVLLNFA